MDGWKEGWMDGWTNERGEGVGGNPLMNDIECNILA
jgi:hypothetical protein